MRILHHFDLTSDSPYQFSAESVRCCKQVGTGEVTASSVHSRGKHPQGSGCLRGKPSARPLILCQARGTSFEEAKLRELSWSCLSPLCPWWWCLWVPKAPQLCRSWLAGAGSCSTSTPRSFTLISKSFGGSKHTDVMCERAHFSPGWWLPRLFSVVGVLFALPSVTLLQSRSLVSGPPGLLGLLM